MNYIEIKNLNIEFPIYSIENKSLRHVLMNSVTGGMISNRSKRINVVKAISDLNLYVQDGERISVLGHNGSGKSTLLRAIAGIYPPTDGTVRVVGDVSTMIDPALGIDPEASGYENIYTRGLFLGKSKEEITIALNEIIEFSELGDFISLPVRTYSSGMVMRLAFSIATAFKPDILLLDEWLSVGDTQFREKAAERLGAFVNSASIVVLATNDEELAARVSTRMIRLEHGCLISDDNI